MKEVSFILSVNSVNINIHLNIDKYAIINEQCYFHFCLALLSHNNIRGLLVII